MKFIRALIAITFVVVAFLPEGEAEGGNQDGGGDSVQIAKRNTTEDTTEDLELVLEFARIAEPAARYEELVTAMNRLATAASDEVEAFDSEERNLLDAGYQNVVAARLSSWRVISSIEQKPDNGEKKLQVLRGYRAAVEKELKDYCNDVLDLIRDHLLPNAVSPEARCLYKKMRGDYNRYMAEVVTGLEREGTINQSRLFYEEAKNIAETHLEPTDPLRLELALSFSILYYELLNDTEKACELAKNAFDNAMAKLYDLSVDEIKESDPIMKLLRDKSTLWSCD